MRACFIVVVAILGCRRAPTIVRDDAAPTAAPIEARSAVVIGRRPDDGFGADFEVPARTMGPAGPKLTVRARAAIEGAPVDLEVVFEPPANGMFGYVELRPIGVGGDALLAALARAWKQPERPRTMRAARGTAAWLGPQDDDPRGSVFTKVFLGADEAELYVNWNPATSMLELLEKDPDYREGVIAALTK